MTRFRYLQFLLLGSICCGGIAMAQTSSSELQITVQNGSGATLACRIHLTDDSGEPQRPDGYPFWNDHFVCDGKAMIHLPAGDYRYQIERGPEYQQAAGDLTIGESPIELEIELTRISHLRDAGWYSGDLHVHRPPEQIELLMRAEDLDYAPVITWWNNRNAWQGRSLPETTNLRFEGHRISDVMAGEDEREGGALLYFGLDRPLQIQTGDREFPSPMQFVEQAHRADPMVWIDIEKPFWWDVPMWLASSQMDSIGIANNHMCRSTMLANEAWGKPRDAERLPAPRGNGFWTQEIYYQMLESGIYLPPSAGSASGVLPNPVGYNRVYTHLGEGVPFSEKAWFDALRRGRCFVTNGPLLLVTADGELPGSRFELTENVDRQCDLQIELTSRDPIARLEVVHNGEVAAVIDCDPMAVSQRRSVSLNVSEPGWFLVRAITENEATFRFASTAPWIVEGAGGQRRVSRRSAQFFLDWTRQRIRRVEANVGDVDRLRSILRPHHQAEAYWQQTLADANAP